MMKNKYGVIAAVSGALTVLLGAFAAHGLKPYLNEYQTGIWQTAVFYQLVHSLLLLHISGLSNTRYLTWSKRSLTLGLILFPGSLYLLAMSGVKILGAITPIGGTAFVVGWFLLAFHYYKR